MSSRWLIPLAQLILTLRQLKEVIVEKELHVQDVDGCDSKMIAIVLFSVVAVCVSRNVKKTKFCMSWR